MAEAPKLRPYQVTLHEATMRAMTKHRRLLVVGGCGLGKTFLFSYLSHLADLKGSKIVILSNRSELLVQSDGALSAFGVTAEYISPEYKAVPTSNIVVCMAQTLRRRIDKPEYQEFLRTRDVFIIDEAHSEDFTFLFKSGLIDGIRVVGYTATPRRVGHQRQLYLDYDAIVEGESSDSLMNKGWLVRAKYYALDAPDLSKVGIDSTTGDYRPKELYKVFGTTERYDGVVENYLRICDGMSAICYCCNQAHAIETCRAFNEAGVSAKFVVSGMKKDSDEYPILMENLKHTGNRAKVFGEFKRGEFKVLCNVSIATTGTDLPIARVCILNCSTMSITRYLQEVGRISRPYEGKEFGVVLDMGNQVSRFGIYEAPRKWSLYHDEKDSTGVPMTKLCDPDKKDSTGRCGCGRLIHLSASVCGFCGFIFATPRELHVAELTEIVGGKFQFKDMTPEQLLAHAELEGKSKVWAFGILWMRSRDSAEFRKVMKSLGWSWKYAMKLDSEFKARGRKRYRNED